METIGDYSIIKEIGQGAFGKVFLAEHRFIKKQFAVKLLSEELCSDTNFIKRFEKYSSLLTELDHPSIVKIHSISCDENRYYIVMDPIVDSLGETMNLDRYLDLKGRVLSESDVETILSQIASALDYAHQLAWGDNEYIFHGSLKLSNLLVNRSDNGLRIFLSDFGISHLVGEEKVLLAAYKNFTEALNCEKEALNNEKKYHLYRCYIRNFSFLSPEQKNLSMSQILNAKTDCYAFGVLTYFLMTREFPEGCFDFPTYIAHDYKLNWDLLVAKCLSKDPSKRPVYLTKAMEELLHNEHLKTDLFHWKDVEKKVEDVLQMSFEFSQKENLARQQAQQEKGEVLSFFAPPNDNNLKPILKPQEINRPVYDPDPGTIFQRDLTVSRYQPAKVEIKEVEPLLTDMVIIPGGSYFRGSNEGARDEMPRHAVTIRSFALDIHPVTNEQFVRFLMAMGGEKDSNNNDIIRLRHSRIKRSAGKLIIESGYSRHPVVGITWYGAIAYAKWVGKRLPTEAEWEIASCGGLENCSYPTGDSIERSQANFFSSDTTAVMSYPPNNYGLYDMVGNVYDWCHDWYAYNYYDTSVQEPDFPQGPAQGVYRVLRGGCWKSLKEDLRCSHRHRNNPGAVNGTYGFRCSADVANND